MATADEILAAEVCDDILTVDLDSRVINIPKNVTNIGVESDDEVRKLHFRVPQYYCDIDLSKFVIRINYMNAKKGGDVYDVMSSEVVDGEIHFDWVVGRNAVAFDGNVSFIVCLKDVDSEGNVLREFNTTIATLPVLPGLETGEAIVNEYYDLLEQWKASLFGAGDTIEQQIKDAGTEVLSQVSSSGDSYIQNIKNTGDGYVQQITDTGDTEEQKVIDAGNAAVSDISGIKQEVVDAGDNALQEIEAAKTSSKQEVSDLGFSYVQEIIDTGNAEEQQVRDAGTEVISNISKSVDEFIDEHSGELTGPRGFTFTPTVDDESNISWTNDGGLPNPDTKNIKGAKGDKGDPFIYSDFTEEQLKALTGPKGDKGDPFTYDMFTDEQLEALTGPKGDKGMSIVSIDRTSGTGAAGTTDTYTITLSDGSTHSFYVYNGADGDGAGDMVASVYDPQGKNIDIFDYVDKKIGELTVVNAEAFESLIEQGG